MHGWPLSKMVLLLIELLTQPLGPWGDTSVSLSMINLNFIHRSRPLPDAAVAVECLSVCLSARMGRVETQGQVEAEEKWQSEVKSNESQRMN